MAMQQRKRRRRSGGSSNSNGAANPNKHYESNGPDVRIRGSAAQILEKYLQYARDAQTSGDRVKAEALYQHAEHYARIVAEVTKEQEKQRREREARDAAKAEERAAREAEERAERHGGDDASDDDEDEGSSAVAESNESSTDDSEDASKHRSRTRKPAESDHVSAEATGEDAEKPRRGGRRRTYEPRDGGDDDGVAKTLARGIEPAAVEGEA